MKVSLFSQSLFALPLAEAIQATADAGFEAIELACASPHLNYETAIGHPEEVATEIRRAGLAVSALSLFNNFTDGAQLQQQVEMAATFIALAPLFQTRIIKLTPGPPDSFHGEEEHWRHLAEAIDKLAINARKAGVKLAFETHMRQLTDTLASSKRLLDMSPEDCVGLTVDFSNLRFAGENMPEVIAQLQGRIVHTHLKNGYIDSGGGWHFQALDTGMTDYAEIIRLLRKSNYDGYLSIECLGPESRTHPGQTARNDLRILNRYLRQYDESPET
ncbi:MAG: sugar phosphate isomerase/epimerase [bacterium]|nr:sugar phosphate isomerase/epimerase [bacterium]